MITRELGPGLAPDVGFFHGAVYVAFGTETNLQLHTFSPQGAPIDRFPFDGFFNSFPRITVPVVVYKAIEHDAATDVSVFPATAFRLDTGAVMRFPPSADGNWPCVVVDADTVAWQTGGAFEVWVGSLSSGRPTRTALHGAPDGLESVANGVAVCRKDIRLKDPAVGGYPSYAGDLTVGQYGYGIGVRLDGQAVRWIPGDPSDDHPDPRCATDGVHYAIVCWGARGVRLYLGTRADLLALPLAPTDVPVPVPPDPPDPVPPDPVPVPPDPPVPVPPKPVGPFPTATRYEVPMSKPVALRMGQFFVRIDPAENGKGPFGWYPVHFDQKTPDNTQCRFTESTPHNDQRLLYRHDVSQAILGADATEFGTDICGQFYGKPNVSDGDSGGYENWNGWVLGSDGITIVLVEYNRDGAKYTSACLTVVPL